MRKALITLKHFVKYFIPRIPNFLQIIFRLPNNFLLTIYRNVLYVVSITIVSSGVSRPLGAQGGFILKAPLLFKGDCKIIFLGGLGSEWVCPPQENFVKLN